MKKLFFIAVFMFSMAFCFNVVNAASAKLEGDVEKNIKAGVTVSDKKIDITLNGNEVSHFKDSITVNIDGAEWTSFSDKGNIDSNVTYEKINGQTIKLHINVNDTMVTDGYTIKVPLNCVIKTVKANMTAVVDYGFSDIAKSNVTYAAGEVSRAYIDGSVKTVTQNEKLIKEKKDSYKNLNIRVTPDDAERTRDKIKITFEGFRLLEYVNSGRVYCDRGEFAHYRKIGDTTLEITFDAFPPELKNKGYTIALPTTGIVTGTGDISAVVDFGVDYIEPCRVVFARVDNGGTVSVQASDSNMPIETANTVSSVTIKDDTTNNYAGNTKINVQLTQIFHFVTTPKITATGKFEGKVRLDIDKNDNQKAVITFTQDIKAGETGTITISDPVIERSANVKNKFQTVEMKFTSKIWSDLSAAIAAYKEGANSNPPLEVIVGNGASPAKKYSALSGITINDNSAREYKSGAKILLSFDNNYKVFDKGNIPVAKGSGKFENNCEFKIEKGQAYILIPKAVSSGNGSIAVNGIVLERSSEESFENGVFMTAVVEGDDSSRNNVQVAKYSSLYDTVPQTTVAENSTETTTANTEGIIKFTIGSKEFTVNGKKGQLIAEPYIKDGYTMLPMRAIANAAGISDDNISFADGTAIFKISNSKTLEITVNKDQYVLAGVSVPVSTPAEIVNGTMFLAVRDLANAVGVKNENIFFDSATKEVSLKIG